MAFTKIISLSLQSSASRAFKQFSASSREVTLREVGNGNLDEQ